MDKIYLDYAGSTPVDPRVLEAMMPYFLEKCGNPGGLHSFGQEAMAALDDARGILSRIFSASGAERERILFTGSATEANNLALRGAVKQARRVANITKPKVITSVIEHESILETCRDLETEGGEVVFLPVNSEGVVDVKALESALDDQTVFVSIMYANNQMGAVQPLADIGTVIRRFRESHNSAYPLFHTDAVQGFQYLDCNVQRLGVDFLTISAQKIYGPKGVGALYVRNIDTITPMVTGGMQQEFGKRSGTENVPGIVGLGKAAEITEEIKAQETIRMCGLQEYFWKTLKAQVASAELNGPSDFSLVGQVRRTPNNLSVYIPGHSGQDLITALDLKGVAVSTGAACSVRRALPPYAIRALGHSDERAGQTIRISLGRQTTENDIDEAVRRITIVVNKK